MHIRSSKYFAIISLLLYQSLLFAQVPTFEEFKSSAYKNENGIYIVDGDNPIQNESELMDYYNNKFS